MSLLEVDGVSKTFSRGRTSRVQAVDNVNLNVEEGETVAVIGESGSGKSTLARLVLGLVPADAGTIRFDGDDISSLRSKERRKLRSRMTAVFQEPFESLDPRMRVAQIVEEPLTIHRRDLRKQQRREEAVDALEKVGLGERFLGKYPGQLSGGQQQRVSLARAIVTRPRLVILDEPTSSLDLSVQAQVLELLAELRQDLDVGYLFITHNLNVAEFVSDRVAVMYGGKLVEVGAGEQVLHHPTHTYTQALLASQLSPEPPAGNIPRMTGLSQEGSSGGHGRAVGASRAGRPGS